MVGPPNTDLSLSCRRCWQQVEHDRDHKHYWSRPVWASGAKTDATNSCSQTRSGACIGAALLVVRFCCSLPLYPSRCHPIHVWPYPALPLWREKAIVCASLSLPMVSSIKVSMEALRRHQPIYGIWRPADVARLQLSLLKRDCEAVTDVQLHTLPKISICSQKWTVAHYLRNERIIQTEVC